MIRWLLLASLAAPAAAQFAYTVTSLANAGPGTLRDALDKLHLAPPATATITLAVAGTCTLSGAALPYPPLGTRLTIDHSFPSGRFAVDARPVSATTPVHGLLLRAPGARILAPLTLLVDQGIGLETVAASTQVADLEIVGGSQAGFAATAVTGLDVGSLAVRGAGTNGILLANCAGARLGSPAQGQVVRVIDCSGKGIQIAGGTAVTVAPFEVRGCQTGIVATGAGHRLGSTDGPRSAASGNLSVGIQLLGTTGGVVLQRIDLEDDGGVGLVASGCDGLLGEDLVANRCGAAGIQFENGSQNLELRRTSCANAGTGLGTGLTVFGASAVNLRDCVFGPGNRFGLAVATNDLPAGLRIFGGRVWGNWIGVSLTRTRDIVLAGTTIEDQTTTGLFADGVPGVVLSDVVVQRNMAEGIHLLNCPDSVLGPGGRFDDNRFAGLWIQYSDRCRIEDNRSCARNYFAGIYVLHSNDVLIRGITVAANTGNGITMLQSHRAHLGPGIQVLDTLGTGVRFEICNQAVLESVQVWRASSAGVSIIACAQVATLRSCLIADCRDLGVVVRESPVTDLVACTIAGCYRGVHANVSTPTAPSLVQLKSCVLRRNILDDYGTTDPGGKVVPSYSFVQNPAPPPNDPLQNKAADPLLADELRGDYRLRSNSPAIDAGEVGLGFPANAQDAYGGTRLLNGRVDCGAHEAQPSPSTLDFFPNTMPLRGGRVDFTLRWPVSEAGKLSFVLFNVTGPGSFPLWGITIPLGIDPFMQLVLGLEGTLHAGTLLVPVPPTGVIQGHVDYTGLQLVPLRVYAVGFTVHPVTGGSLVSNLATYVIK